MRRELTILLLCIGLAVSGCGGGGGTALMIGDQRADQALIDALLGERDAAQEALAAAQAQLMAIQGEAASPEAAVAALNTTIAELQAQLMAIQGEADSPEAAIMALNEQITTLTGQLTAIQMDPERYASAQARVDALVAQIAGLEAQLTAIQMDPDMYDSAEARVMALERALTEATNRLAMIRGDADSAEDAVAGLRARVTELEGQLANIQNPTENAEAAKTLRVITKGKQADETTAPDTPGFASNSQAGLADETLLEGFSDPQTGTAIGDFAKYTYTRPASENDNGSTDQLVIYSDRTALDTVNFNAYYRTEVGDRPAYANVTGITVTETGNNRSLQFATGLGTTAVDGAIGDRFAANISLTTARPSMSGTFHGVPGLYECAATSCTVGYAGGKAASITIVGTGAFTFTPSNPSTKIQSVKPDNDYLSFGYWLNTPTTGDPSVTVFAFGGNQLTDATGAYLSDTGSGTAIQGTATYEGPAAGKFAKTTASQQTGKAVATQAGLFMADANLTASFSGPNVSANDQFTLSGTVDNFRNQADGSMIAPNWSVTLGRTGFASNNTEVATSLNDNGGAFGGAGYSGVRGGETTGGGTWNADFYGPVTDDTTTTLVNEAAAPMGIAGTFDATFNNGNVIGAFGATKQ